MQGERENALTELKRLSENLKSCKQVLPDGTWEDEVDQILVWACNDGCNSSLPEINKRIEDIKMKVRASLTLFCFFSYLYSNCRAYFSVGITIQKQATEFP